jgi:hypothetical protein
MLVLLCAWLVTAEARELAGVGVPDTATVGGQALVLNGMGLREKFYFDIYVGSLYLPAKTTSSSAAITQDVCKRLSMTFLYAAVSKAQLAEAYDEALPHLANSAAVKARFDILKSYLSDVVAGDVITFDYVPGTGTTVVVKGSTRGTITGKDFMEALWAVYLGTHPPTAKLKSGLLGAS